MKQTNTVLRLVALAACVLAGAGAGRAVPQGRREADPWKDYVLASRWEEGADYFARAMAAECAAPGGPSFDRLASLHYGYSVCRHFPEISKQLDAAPARRLKEWLLANRQFNEAFLLALRPSDDTARAFEILCVLLADSEDMVILFPQLAIAFAVVWDAYPSDSELLLGSFRYFTRNADRMEFDLSSLPHQVSKYIIDTRRPVFERLWALDKYEGTANMGRLYRRIWQYQYESRFYTDGDKLELDQPSRTLQDIRQNGGVCHDAAVFASEVGKATGVPSVYIGGSTPSGEEHAWVGYIRQGSTPQWDRDTGRLGNEDALAGTVREPHAGVRVSEHELDFALAALRYPPEQRRAARIRCDVAAILAQVARDSEQASTDVTGARSAALAAPRLREQARRAMYGSLNTCIYDELQWHTFARLAKDGVFSPKDVMEVLPEFMRRLGSYPNLAVEALEVVGGTLPATHLQRRLELYDEAADLFERRNSEAVVRLRLLKGRLLESLREYDAAVEAYSAGIPEAIRRQSTFIPLLDSAGRVLVGHGAVEDAIKLHEKTRFRLTRPQASAYAFTSSWAQVTLRLAKLHALGGDRKTHNDLLRDILERQRMSDRKHAQLEQRLTRLTYQQLDRSNTSPR